MAAFPDDYEHRMTNPCRKCRGAGLITVQECDGLPLTAESPTMVVRERATTCPECHGSGTRPHLQQD